MLGATLGYISLSKYIPDLTKVAAMMSGSYIGGGANFAAMAISKGWIELIDPIMVVGTLGYIIGNYFGIIIGNILM